MKALFKSHFPFVEGTPEEELTSEQKLIKKTYDKLYPDNTVSGVVDSKKKTGQAAKIKKAEADRLREVHGNDEPASGGQED